MDEDDTTAAQKQMRQRAVDLCNELHDEYAGRPNPSTGYVDGVLHAADVLAGQIARLEPKSWRR